MILALCWGLSTLPVSALCGSCSTIYDLLFCGTDGGNTGCRTFRCLAEGDLIGPVQWADCCEEYPCIP